MKFEQLLLILLLLVVVSLEIGFRVRGEEVRKTEDKYKIVKTTSGPVQGSLTPVITNQNAYVFYGIPYAEAPVRFKPPQPVRPWTKVFKASEKPLPCYQQEMKYSWLVTATERDRIKRPWSEECLTLNIWTPAPMVHDAPVVVVFHSGTFGQGSNNNLDGSIMASLSEVVVVSMNYRLGAFGFLYLGVPDAPGNVGLLDQQLALKWVQDNIDNFGGKKQAIILLGAANAGAASVGFQLLSPGSKNLFKTISTRSGSPLCPWAFQDKIRSLDNTKALCERLGCDGNTTELLLQCLQNVHPEDIVDATSEDLESNSLQFLPTSDDTFLTESPLESLKNGHFDKKVILSVSSTNEASIPFYIANADILPNLEKGISLDLFRKSVKRLIPTVGYSDLNAIEEFYIGKCHQNDPVQIRDAAFDVYSDVLINCCMNEFNYLYSDRGGIVFPVVADFVKQSNPSWVRSSHGLELEFILGYSLLFDGYNTDEINLSYFALDWIKQTARQNASEMRNVLSTFDSKDKNYTVWGMAGPKYLSNYREDYCKLWSNVIPKLSNLGSDCKTV